MDKPPNVSTSIDVVVMENDLMFLSKITGFAAKFDKSVRIVKNVSRCVEACLAMGGGLCLLNLECLQSGDFDILQECVEQNKSIRFVGYGPHVNVELLREAKEIGIEALPRSLFVQKLSDSLFR